MEAGDQNTNRGILMDGWLDAEDQNRSDIAKLSSELGATQWTYKQKGCSLGVHPFRSMFKLFSIVNKFPKMEKLFTILNSFLIFGKLFSKSGQGANVLPSGIAPYIFAVKPPPQP